MGDLMHTSMEGGTNPLQIRKKTLRELLEERVSQCKEGADMARELVELFDKNPDTARMLNLMNQLRIIPGAW